MHVSNLDDAERLQSTGGSTIRELAGRVNTGDELLLLWRCAAPCTPDDTVVTGS